MSIQSHDRSPKPTPPHWPSSTRVITGTIVDAATGKPIAGITVAAAPAGSTPPRSAANEAALGGSRAPVGNPRVVTATTARDGTFSLPCGTAFTVNEVNFCDPADFFFSAYGGTHYANNAFHGRFWSLAVYGNGGTGLNVGTLKLTKPTAEEVAALAQINRFRAAPGPIGGPTFPQYGGLPPLLFDEDLIETARYWATEVHHYWNPSWTTRSPHTCAGLGNPPGCLAFDTYYTLLPGFQLGGSSQNISIFADGWTGPTHAYANQGFESEGMYCAPSAWNWQACPDVAPDGHVGQTGHFRNIMGNYTYAGLGEVQTKPSDYVQVFD
ncbi:MAG: CAP domain-containing protein [Vulcanimicrobiaceae bacterium]